MPCCGQNRNAWNDTSAPQRQTTPAQLPAANPSGGLPASAIGTVRLRYLEQSPILVRGPVTGRYYEFSEAQPDQYIDSRDAPQLLRTSFFRRAN